MAIPLAVFVKGRAKFVFRASLCVCAKEIYFFIKKIVLLVGYVFFSGYFNLLKYFLTKLEV